MEAGLTGLTHLDLFGAQITDSGTKYLSCKLKQLLFFLTVNFSSPFQLCSSTAFVFGHIGVFNFLLISKFSSVCVSRQISKISNHLTSVGVG